MDLRRKPGEVLDDVARNGRAFIIERNGQQKACLVPISFFLPDIQASRLTREFDSLAEANQNYRVAFTDTREIQIIFQNIIEKADIQVTVTLSHGYPNRAPIVAADPIDEACPHRWRDGSLCIYGAMDTWNPGKHDLMHTLMLCRRWLTHYLEWQQTSKWPKQEG